MTKKILIIDDEAQTVNMLKHQLEASGYAVITAGDGQVGLEKARKEHPDLIILDLMLPKIDGYKVCRMLKFDENYKQMPIIIFTGKAARRDFEIGELVGADAYIVKPLDPEALIAKIQELLKPASR